MKILTGNFKKQVTTGEGKAHSEKRSLTGRQIAPISDFRGLSKVHRKNDNVQAFNTKWNEVLSALTDRLTDNMLERLSKMQVEKVGRAGQCVAILRSRGDIRRQEIRLMQIEVGGPKTSRAEKSKILMSKREFTTRTDLQ